MIIKTAKVLAADGTCAANFFRDVDAVETAVLRIEQAFRKQASAFIKRSKLMAETAATYLASFSHPNPGANKHLETLYELFDKVEMLQSIHAMLVSGFSEMRKAQPLIARVQALILHSKRRVDSAMAALSTCVERHQPEYFSKCVSGIVGRLQKLYAGSYNELNVCSLARVIVTDSQEVVGTQFSTYLCFRGLTDCSGYVHDRYHVVLTCIVDKHGRYSMNMALQPTMLLPGKFRSSDLFSSYNDGAEIVMQRLKEEGFDLGDANGSS